LVDANSISDQNLQFGSGLTEDAERPPVKSEEPLQTDQPDLPSDRQQTQTRKTHPIQTEYLEPAKELRTIPCELDQLKAVLAEKDKSERSQQLELANQKAQLAAAEAIADRLSEQLARSVREISTLKEQLAAANRRESACKSQLEEAIPKMLEWKIAAQAQVSGWKAKLAAAKANERRRADELEQAKSELRDTSEELREWRNGRMTELTTLKAQFEAVTKSEFDLRSQLEARDATLRMLAQRLTTLKGRHIAERSELNDLKSKLAVAVANERGLIGQLEEAKSEMSEASEELRRWQTRTMSVLTDLQDRWNH
jgi:chromosome segregation ATPase